MTMTAAQPYAMSISAAADELERCHCISARPPREIAVLSNLRTLSEWLRRLQTHCITAEPHATKAAEWILDNHFHVERAIRQIRKDMPKAFYARLPSLEGPEHKDAPRVYRLAYGFLEASHLQLTLPSAVEFTAVYQIRTPLTIAELWAFPTMLRLACLEVLVGASSILFPKLRPPFEAEADIGDIQTIDPTERIARSLASLQIISSISWKDFFDRTSQVEQALREDPTSVYPRMDFDTRDQYRKAIEDIAAGAGASELETAKKVLVFSEKETPGSRRSHVGYWLIGDGRTQVEKSIGYRPSFAVATKQLIFRRIGLVYSGAIITLCAASLCVPVLYLLANDASPAALIAGIILTLIPATILSLTVVNWIFTFFTSPKRLPKLDFEKGISEDCGTAIVMPVIVGSQEEAHAFVERLEMHWLTNPEPRLRYVLLSDQKDAPTERTADDQLIEHALITGISRLNSEHGVEGNGPFHLLHRPRLSNPCENCWMAWERKRGKLEQFNTFVLTGDKSPFTIDIGDSDRLRSIQFVITVDADTEVPMGAVNRLVGAMAHPMNRAEFDPEDDSVRAGFTVIQPRVEISPECGPRSPFFRFFTGDTAIDIYSQAVSDIYQDLFGSAVYIGKGIYDVAAFDRSLKERVPENSLLSHDLFEGAHGRAGLASDIVFYDGFPSTYLEYARRWHRWVRGDWQLIPWLAGRVPGAGGKRHRNRLSLLDRWKIFDNLRRSLIPPALIALAAAGWFFLPGNAWAWTFLTILAPGAHLLTDLATGLSRGRRRSIVQNSLHQFAEHAGRWGLAVALLPYEASISADAIGRTLWRLLVSRKNLLEWTSAAHAGAEIKRKHPRRHAWSEMCAAPILAATFFAGLAVFNPGSLPAASGLLVLWFFSPEIALWISRPYAPRRETLSADDRAFLRQVARRTWYFYETFVGPEDNWLPPDNYQEDPDPVIAHRTSPTNIGMMFISSLTAWDFGYLSPADFAIRFQNGLDALDKLDRYRGHFLNWYDTRLLTPLEPRYVSTVDSGNLAVCLITLKEGCLEAANSPAIKPNRWSGLRDTFDLLTGALENAVDIEANSPLRIQMASLKDKLARVERHSEEWREAIENIVKDSWPGLEKAISDAVKSPKTPSLPEMREINAWIERFNHDLSRLHWDFEGLFPWLTHTKSAPPSCAGIATDIERLLAPSMTVNDAATKCKQAAAIIADVKPAHAANEEAASWLSRLESAIEEGEQAHRVLKLQFLRNAARADAIAFEMDFHLLYDRDLRLFNIGYNVSSDRMDPHHYDLLATEARLASYFAIAKGDVPSEHWRFLGRPITRIKGELILLSWDGSMFEYLMPPLLLKSDEGTLLNEAEKSAVIVQRQYAEKFDTPWGVSESGFAARDASHHYQYRAFGVPGLGLRRGLSEDIVISPYASSLALAVYPVSATRNLKKLAQLGLLRRYGFVEAADFTPERTAGRSFTPVRSFMAHHQGMTITAIGNALHDDIMPKRFSANMQMRSASLLLQERTPWELPPEPLRKEEPAALKFHPVAPPTLHPWKPQSAAAATQYHLLGNGRFATWISEAGGGALWWRDQALTRWRWDTTRDNLGLWVYARDKENNALWSVSRQPTGVVSRDAHVLFHPHMAEFHRRDHGVAIRMEVGVAAGDDLEIRLITITNETERERNLEITSCADVALAPPLTDERHPAFSKLFVESEYLPEFDGLLFKRRPHDSNEQPPALLHRIVSDDLGLTSNNFEADRSAFYGRNGTARRPPGVTEGLSGASGWTLDPIMAMQAHIKIPPHGRRQLAFVTVAAGSQETVIETAERYTTIASLEWALHDAAREAAHEAQLLNLGSEQLPTIQAFTSFIADPHSSLLAPPMEREANKLGQPRLWSLGVSGDNPIVLARIGDPPDKDFLRRLVRMHELWRRRLFRVDLIIIRAGVSGYVEPLRERLLSLFRETGAYEKLGRNGGVHLVFADQITNEDKRLLECSARIILDDARGALEQQLAAAQPHTLSPYFEPTHPAVPAPAIEPLPREALDTENAYGGFTKDNEEYVINLDPGESTPAPWCNVLANDQFGCLTSEAGMGFTWGINSGENRLTPWTNDPVCDPQGEAIYLRDEETAEIWTPTPSPAGKTGAYQIRHGAGYTTWLNSSHGLKQDLTIFVAPNDAVKIARLRLFNPHTHTRRITATYYAEWQLGALQSIHAPHVVCKYDAEEHAFLAQNSWNPEFSNRVAFMACNRSPHSMTTDRRDFLGREGDLERPAGLSRWDLGGRINGAGDPCAAYQAHLDIEPGKTVETVFLLGEGSDLDDAKRLIRKWRNPEGVQNALISVREEWKKRLETVQVKTPERAFDLMMNRWLLYQAFSSRILARAGFYQAGGAIGFRDQLQDMMALFLVDPARVRAHILDCAARQFEEGDVLHWWHPPSGRGVRTRCSDDFLWLPFVTSRYVEATGDDSILSETAPFLTAPPLSQKEDDRYGLFEHTSQKATLYEHCLRAMDRGVTQGRHGLPLIGAGDWNDGMNRIGAHGRGESVWLAWFSIATMNGFAEVAIRYGQPELADEWRTRAENLKATIDEVAWDGDWYVRAFDDDGHPWGSKNCDECRIDSIAQSWAVLSGAGATDRAITAVRSAVRELVNDEERLVKLLWPPFHDTPRDPGYIKAYPPGVRENGGQYSHASAWLGLALAELGDGDGAYRIFDIINPIGRTMSREAAQGYRDEPYVLAADVAGSPPHVGRGGWSWYTGAAAWTWRLGLEGILGLRMKRGAIQINPSLPASWGYANATIKGPSGVLSIEILDPGHVGSGVVTLTVDGAPIEGSIVAFPTDGSVRRVQALLNA